MSSLTGAHDAFRTALGTFELAQSGDARVTDLVAPSVLYESVEHAATRVMDTPAQDFEDVLIKFEVLSAWYLADVWLDHQLDDRAARAYRIAAVELEEFATRLQCRHCGKFVLR